MKWSMKCTCGQIVTTEAPDKATAVNQIVKQMEDYGLQKHMDEMHNGEPAPTVDQVRMMTEGQIQEGEWDDAKAQPAPDGMQS